MQSIGGSNALPLRLATNRNATYVGSRHVAYSCKGNVMRKVRSASLKVGKTIRPSDRTVTIGSPPVPRSFIDTSSSFITIVRNIFVATNTFR